MQSTAVTRGLSHASKANRLRATEVAATSSEKVKSNVATPVATPVAIPRLPLGVAEGTAAAKDAVTDSSASLIEPSGAREKIGAAVALAQVKLGANPFIEPVVAKGRAAVERVAAARAAAALWTQELLIEAIARAQLLKDLADSTSANVKAKGLRACVQEAAGSAREAVCELTASAKGKAQDAIVATSDVVSQPVFKTSAVAAIAGGSTLGAVGATAGVVLGGVAGGLAGLPLALFTFGLSIPTGAVLGSSAGGALGLASGAAVGLVGGGTIGYTGFKNQDKIREVGASAVGKVSDSAGFVQGRALASAEYAREAVKATKLRLTGAGTGGTPEARP